LRDIPKTKKLRVLFEDEGRFGRISDTRRCWVPISNRAVVGHQVIREYIYSLTAVSPLDGQLASLIMPWVDSDIMSIFLSYTAREFPEDFCLMFLDGAGWHRANNLRVPMSMKLIWLPPYSPELNPTEHVWDHIRENYFGNHIFESLDEVEEMLCNAFTDLAKQTDLVRSLTCFDWINALCMTSN
jgi:hypothetical protein